MRYLISATSGNDNAAEAIKRAVELVSKGLWDVHITDAQTGQRYGHLQFAQLFGAPSNDPRP